MKFGPEYHAKGVALLNAIGKLFDNNGNGSGGNNLVLSGGNATTIGNEGDSKKVDVNVDGTTIKIDNNKLALEEVVISETDYNMLTEEEKELKNYVVVT